MTRHPDCPPEHGKDDYGNRTHTMCKRCARVRSARNQALAQVLGAPAPETVALFVVQYRDKHAAGTGTAMAEAESRNRRWVSMSPMARHEADNQASLARDVWGKEVRLVRIAGTVVGDE